MYKKTVLNNGLRVITHAMPSMQSVALGVWIKVGGRYENRDNKGISHFLEHLVFKGTKKYSCRKIKESIEGVGGSLNGFTSEELTCYLVKMPERYMGLGFSVLSDMVINPLLPAAEIEKEKTVVLEEIKMHKDLPQSYVHDLLDEILWPGHPLGMTILGTADSVCRIKKEGLSSFKEKYYTPSNIVVSAAGSLDNKKFLRIIEDTFVYSKARKEAVFSKTKEGQSLPQLKLFHKDTEQTHLALGFHSFKREHHLKHALGLMHIILGANMSSRLFNELREKRGLAYEIGTQVKRLQDTGAFVVHAGIDNRKVGEAIKLILNELQKLKNKPVSVNEFKRAKEFYLGQLMLALEDTLDHMLWIGESTSSLDKTYTLEDIIKETNKVTLQDIQLAAKFIFKKEKLNLALIGPLKDKEKEIYSQLRI